jgi:acyl-CoA thioesterase
MNDKPNTPLENANRLLSADRASQAFGIEVTSAAAGRCVLTMRVRADMANGFSTCHGGVIFALADSAFAFACNGEGHPTVAAAASIDFLAAASPGDTLTASAVELWRGGRSGLYEVRVEKQTGEVVALFRGRSHRVGQGRGAEGAAS